MATHLFDIITELSDKELYSRLASGFNTSALELERKRRRLPKNPPRPVKSGVSRGRGHAKRAVRPSSGRVDLGDVIVGTLRPPSVGSHVPPWIRHAKV